MGIRQNFIIGKAAHLIADLVVGFFQARVAEGCRACALPNHLREPGAYLARVALLGQRLYGRCLEALQIIL